MEEILQEVRNLLKTESILHVSRNTGLSRVCLYNILNQKGKTINLSTLHRLGDYFGKTKHDNN